MKKVDLPEMTDNQKAYHDFLKSESWQQVRNEIRCESDVTCFLCGSVGIGDVHHTAYTEDWLDKEYLVYLCRECHEVTHEMLKDFAEKTNTRFINFTIWNEFIQDEMCKYYRRSWLHHADSVSFFHHENLTRLADFIRLSIWNKYAAYHEIRVYTDYGTIYDDILHLGCTCQEVRGKLKEDIAYMAYLIEYTHGEINPEILQNHFKVGNNAWGKITKLIKKYETRYLTMKNLDFSNVQATNGGEFARPTPGGYVIGIVSVEDVPEREYLKISYDIAEGELKNYYYDMKQRTGYDLPVIYKSYKDSALGFFKAFIDAVTASNAGYKWNNDERTLVRKVVGAVFREEEYKNRDGEIKTSLKPDIFLPIDDIRAGRFTIPKKKTLSGTTQASAAPVAVPAPAAPVDISPDDLFGSTEGIPF